MLTACAGSWLRQGFRLMARREGTRRLATGGTDGGFVLVALRIYNLSAEKLERIEGPED
jgi:hypothetical protein